jgi:hypothetical protein
MAQEVGWTIDEILGWKKTDDGKHALIGLKTTDGQQLALAVAHERLQEIIMSLVAASDAFPAPKGLTNHTALTAKTDWYDLGEAPETGEQMIRLRLTDGGHLSFLMDKPMAVRLAESLSVRHLARRR